MAFAIPCNHSQDDSYKPKFCLIVHCDQNAMSSESGQDILTRQILDHPFNVC